MLTFSEQSVGALRRFAQPAYAARLRASLAEEYPHLLPRFPEPVQDRIVLNMLARASGWGLSRQNALYAWCALMLTVAPNFADEPEIRHALETMAEPRDLGMMSLTGLVSREAWSRAERRASNLPLFVPPQLDGQSPAERYGAAIGIVLHDHPEAGAPQPMVAAAIGEAGALGLGEVIDAPLVVALCRAFWGPQWAGLAWADELRRERWAPRAFVEALRLRLALEYGRFV